MKKTILFLVIGVLLFVLGVLSRPFAEKTYDYVYHFFYLDTVDFPIHDVISPARQHDLDNAIKVSFTGDLLLLRDMIERAYIEGTDSVGFDEMFEHVSEYWRDDDLSIAVFEGPVASADSGYTASCFRDNIPLHLNFPSSFATSVKRAGIDFVTTATNHLLDQGVDGYLHTLDVLDSIHLDHSGSYRTPSEHDQPKILQVKGLKIGVLAFTYGCNNYDDGFFFEKGNEHITCCMMGRASSYYKACQNHVREDFRRLKALHPDIIIALPHIGEQFCHEPDKDQLAWCDLLVEEGADIIFSDHPHTVQPIEWRKNTKGRNVLVVHCPGNFVNSYIEYDGDASMIVEAYLTPGTGEPFAASCIPLYSYCKQKRGRYQALPLYKAIKTDSLYAQLSVADYKRLGAIHKLVTKTALGVELGIDQLQPRYITFADGGYARHPAPPLAWKEEYEGNPLVGMMKAASRICFVGDGITEGARNGGYGWYEPLVAMLGKKDVTRWTKDGGKSSFFAEKRSEIAQTEADLYVIAIGYNDICDSTFTSCEASAQNLATHIDQLASTLSASKPGTRIVILSPWLSYDPDPHCQLPRAVKKQLYAMCDTALEKYCKQKGHLFINPNGYIRQAVIDDHHDRGKYFYDYAYPNADKGIELFSRACVEGF